MCHEQWALTVIKLLRFFVLMVSIDDIWKVVHGLFKELITGPLKSKMAEIRHLGSWRQNAQTRFSQKLSNLELWCPLTTYRKSHMGFSKNLLLDAKNPRWLRSAILKIVMTSVFTADGGPIWIKFRRLVQNDMSTAVMWSKSKPDVEFMADVQANLVACHPRAMPHCRVLPPGEFSVMIPELRVTLHGAATWRIQWHVIPEPRITLQGAATWWIHCHDSRATCHIAGCKNSIRHVESRFTPYLFFCFNAVYALTSGGFCIVSDTLVRQQDVFHLLPLRRKAGPHLVRLWRHTRSVVNENRPWLLTTDSDRRTLFTTVDNTCVWRQSCSVDSSSYGSTPSRTAGHIIMRTDFNLKPERHPKGHLRRIIWLKIMWTTSPPLMCE